MWNNVYRRLLLRTLNKMNKGQLTLTLPDKEVIRIGDGLGIHATLQVLDEALWRRIVLHGDIGFAEGYMDRQWETDDLTALLRWVLLNIDQAPSVSGSGNASMFMNLMHGFNRLTHILRPNSKKGSRKNISEHYDLSNDFFSLFLDKTMTYSSAIFQNGEEDLETAQMNKYDSLCRSANLKDGDHVLEIGTGWGGFAEFAASRYKVRITTVTISKEQYDFATRRIEQAGLADRVEVLLCDYRDISGSYDKVVSIEMIEAVGARYLPVYFRKIQQVLKPDGVLALQAIVCPDNRFDLLKNRVDFIQKHIFPGSLLPSIAAINQAVNDTGDLFLFGLKDLGKSYVRTLAAWRNAFEEHAEDVSRMGFNEVFQRKWKYYFSYCEAAFDMRNINVVQMIYTRPNNFLFGQ